MSCPTSSVSLGRSHGRIWPFGIYMLFLAFCFPLASFRKLWHISQYMIGDLLRASVYWTTPKMLGV
uniref:Uncharacterized protein n=1 Tax=Leersia perrieri TaxID=77586 RepID=A0A0D9W4K3_9ORYZ